MLFLLLHRANVSKYFQQHTPKNTITKPTANPIKNPKRLRTWSPASLSVAPSGRTADAIAKKHAMNKDNVAFILIFLCLFSFISSRELELLSKNLEI